MTHLLAIFDNPRLDRIDFHAFDMVSLLIICVSYLIGRQPIDDHKINDYPFNIFKTKLN